MKRNKMAGLRCVYCGAEASTSDHAVARKFFLVERRDNLPQVPACWKCNNRKSQLESYLMTVLPFGGKHPDAGKHLATLVPARLEKNQKLRRKLARGLDRSGGTSIPFDGKQLEEYLEMVARALAWKHYGIQLGEGHSAIASMFRDGADEAFAELRAGRFTNEVRGDLGEQTFMYVGSQLHSNPEVTMWRFWFYGGIDFADPRTPEPASVAVAVTGPIATIRNLRYISAKKDHNPRKVGRNDPCPCGSGKKHKKCHGAVA